jgi:hypothetical protein
VQVCGLGSEQIIKSKEPGSKLNSFFSLYEAHETDNRLSETNKNECNIFNIPNTSLILYNVVASKARQSL